MYVYTYHQDYMLMIMTDGGICGVLIMYFG